MFKGSPSVKILWKKVPQTILASFLTPQNQANAHLNLDNSPLNKCPKPSWQGFRPPPPHPPKTGNAQMNVDFDALGLP